MYSTYEGKSVVAERFIKIFKHMTAVSKNVFVDVLDDIVDNYNNTFHRIIGMKPIDIKSDSYAECNVDSNEKDPKFKLGDHVKFWNTKSFLLKDILQICLKKFLLLAKINNTVPWTYVISNLHSEEITGTFYEKDLQKTNQKEFRIEKIIKRKGDKLFVKWKGYDNSFNRWINKKDIV